MKEVKYEMPPRIENNYEGLIFFAEIYAKVAELKEVRLTFDFIRTNWFEANFAAVFSSIVDVLHRNECIVCFENVKDEIEIIFMKNGFYEMYELGSVKDTYNSTIPFKLFHTTDEEGFTRYLDEEVIPKVNLPHNSEEAKIFKKCLQEIFENTRIHANSEWVFACGQYFHKKKKVAFTMVDLGKTIGENVREKVNDELVDHSAITWSTEFGNTTKPNRDGGIGLHFLKDQMYNNGVLSILSGNGYWVQDMDTTFSRKIKFDYKGTIVNVVSYLGKSVKSEVNKICF